MLPELLKTLEEGEMQRQCQLKQKMRYTRLLCPPIIFNIYLYRVNDILYANDIIIQRADTTYKAGYTVKKSRWIRLDKISAENKINGLCAGNIQ